MASRGIIRNVLSGVASNSLRRVPKVPAGAVCNVKAMDLLDTMAWRAASTSATMSNPASSTPQRRQLVSVPVVCTKDVQDALKNIDLVVYDMAGTTVEEGGLVYQTLRRVMVEDGMSVSQDAMHPWHGAKKEAVIEHFARKDGTPEHELETRVQRVSNAFEGAISKAYFSSDSRVSVIDDGLMEYFGQLKAAGIKIGLDTGYPADIQEGLVKRLGFDKVVDTYISSYDVPEGRPYPYMIHRIMERCGVMNVARVAKMGDSVRDMEEGRNAGCGLVVGVLSGADSAEDLAAAGADMVVPMVSDLPAPELARPMTWASQGALEPRADQSNI